MPMRCRARCQTHLSVFHILSTLASTANRPNFPSDLQIKYFRSRTTFEPQITIPDPNPNESQIPEITTTTTTTTPRLPQPPPHQDYHTTTTTTTPSPNEISNPKSQRLWKPMRCRARYQENRSTFIARNPNLKSQRLWKPMRCRARYQENRSTFIAKIPDPNLRPTSQTQISDPNSCSYWAYLGTPALTKILGPEPKVTKFWADFPKSCQNTQIGNFWKTTENAKKLSCPSIRLSERFNPIDETLSCPSIWPNEHIHDNIDNRKNPEPRLYIFDAIREKSQPISQESIGQPAIYWSAKNLSISQESIDQSGIY